MDSLPDKSIARALLIGSALLAAAVIWHAEGQRYELAGDSDYAIRLDRRTGETTVCIRRRGPVGGTPDMVAECDGMRR